MSQLRTCESKPWGPKYTVFSALKFDLKLNKGSCKNGSRGVFTFSSDTWLIGFHRPLADPWPALQGAPNPFSSPRFFGKMLICSRVTCKACHWSAHGLHCHRRSKNKTVANFFHEWSKSIIPRYFGELISKYRVEVLFSRVSNTDVNLSCLPNEKGRLLPVFGVLSQ